MKEYQIKSHKNMILPETIYHECIWIVRDMGRLEECVHSQYDKNILNEASVSDNFSRINDNREAEEAAFRLEGIHQALLGVPEEYRHGILNNIINRERYGDFAHENTWKKWKQKFIYSLAVNLHIY